MPRMILIADDNENDAIAIAQTLKQAGVTNPLTIVEDGREVVAYFKGAGDYADRAKYPIPSILLLDLKMRQMGGFEVLEWLNHTPEAKGVLRIILSGYGELADIKRGYELGARSFLPKPCGVEEIHNLIRAYPAYWDYQGPTSSGGKHTDRRAPLGI